MSLLTMGPSASLERIREKAHPPLGAVTVQPSVTSPPGRVKDALAPFAEMPLTAMGVEFAVGSELAAGVQAPKVSARIGKAHCQRDGLVMSPTSVGVA